MSNGSNFIYDVDRICREDLVKLKIVSERDYVSHFCSLLRFPKGIYGTQNQFLHSQTLPGAIEQVIGCDSIIIFNFGNQYKVGLFEAKYPRYKSVNSKIAYRRWDDGRFNKQLDKQHLFLKKYPGVFIWNKFINNGQIGISKKPFNDKNGSTLILHADMYRFYQKKIGGLRH